MRKLFILLFVGLFVLTLAACNKDKQESEAKNVENTNTAKQEEKQEETKDAQAETGNQENSEEESEQGLDLTDYRPAVGSKKSFTNAGELVFTEEIIAANDEYVQTLLQLGDNLTTQIYRWTKDEMTLIYEDFNLENPRQDILNSFEAIEKHETIMSNTESAMTTWKLVENDDNQNVPAGKYAQVLVVQKTTDEVVGEKTTYTRYYAPKIGLIKEEYHLTGENGFKAVSELQSIEK